MRIKDKIKQDEANNDTSTNSPQNLNFDVRV